MASWDPRRLGRVALIAYAAFVVYGTTIPWRFDLDPAAVAARWAEVDWRVVHVYGGRVRRLPDVVANLLFFMPLGVAWALARDARRAASAAAGALIVGAGLSALVEGLQLLTVDRSTQIGDVVFNAGGCALAAGATVVVRARLPDLGATAPGRWIFAGPERVLLALSAALVGLGALAPFDVTLDVGAIKAAVKAFLAAPLGLSGPAEALTIAVPYVLVGYLATRALPTRLGRRRRLVGWAAAAMLGAATEAAQVFVASRAPGLGEVAAAALGAAVGAVACPAVERSIAARGHDPFDRSRPLPAGETARAVGRVAAALLLVHLAVEALAPFALTTPEGLRERFAPRALVPFAGYYRNLHLHVVGEVLAQVALYGAFGYLVAARGSYPDLPPSLAARRRAVVFALLVAAGFEAAQGFVAGRVVDPGDVVLAGLGAWLGVRTYGWLARLGAERRRDAATRRA